MKFLKIVSLLLVAGFAQNSLAASIECTTQSPQLDFLTVSRDGGEETMTLHYLSEKKERLLVLENDGGKIVAIVDRDLDGSKGSDRGVILVIGKNGAAKLALNNDIINMTCR